MSYSALLFCGHPLAVPYEGQVYVPSNPFSTSPSSNPFGLAAVYSEDSESLGNISRLSKHALELNNTENKDKKRKITSDLPKALTNVPKNSNPLEDGGREAHQSEIETKVADLLKVLEDVKTADMRAKASPETRQRINE